MAVFPPTAASRTEPAEILRHSPSLEFDMYLFHAGEAELHVDCLPTQPVGPDRGVRVAISLGNQPPRVLSVNDMQQSVLSNLRRWTTSLTIGAPGHHTLKVWMVDPGVVIDKLVLYTTKPKQSYFGPPESYWRSPTPDGV